MKDSIYKFWQKAPPTIRGMTLHKNIENFDLQEREEILSNLPDTKDKNILELASGIGRFTGRLAEKASHVTTVDFAPQLIEKNRETHKKHSNIAYHIANAMDLSFDEGSFDLVFINWLFMYLSDEETEILFERISKWLKKEGTLFFRESTYHTGRIVLGEYSSTYRHIDEYTHLANRYFTTLNHDIVLTYFLQCKSTNQHYWLCQKD